MRDPHVVALRYRLVTGNRVKFENPPPVEQETERFRMRLADGIVTFEMKEHFSSEEKARQEVGPLLSAWEVQTGLEFGPHQVRFGFEGAEIIDRNPPPPDTAKIIEMVLHDKAVATDSVSIERILPSYPEPPSGFVASPDVETMWQRYEGYLAGREPLTGMAFMCLTVLEASADGQEKRKKAARQYNIDRQVLDNLGELTSEVGDPKTARKAPGRGGFRPHTEAEVAWMEAVVKALIRRAGEWALDPNAARPKLTMADFPNLGTGKS